MLAFRTSALLALGLLSGGCNAAFWGNVGVLGVTVGIFVGTVFLTRTTGDSSSASRSSASSTRS